MLFTAGLQSSTSASPASCGQVGEFVESSLDGTFSCGEWRDQPKTRGVPPDIEVEKNGCFQKRKHVERVTFNRCRASRQLQSTQARSTYDLAKRSWMCRAAINVGPCPQLLHRRFRGLLVELKRHF